MADNDIFIPNPAVVNPKLLWVEILILFFAFFVPGILSGSRDVDPASFDRIAYHAGFYLLALPQIALIVYLIVLQFPRRMDRFGIVRLGWSDILRGILTWIGIFAILAAAGLLVSLLPENRRDVLEVGFRWRFTEPGMIPFAFLTSLITGYREELFFRAYLLTRFAQLGIPFPVSALMSTMMFATGHLYQGWAGFLVAAALGGFLAVVFHTRKSLHVTAIAHALYNFTVLLFLLLRAVRG